MEEDEVQLQEEELENDHTLKTKVDLNCSKRFRSRFFFPWSLQVSMAKQWYRLRKLCDFYHERLNKLDTLLIKMIKVNQNWLKNSSLFNGDL